MMVLILEKVPESLRGQLSRWLLEPKSCVFVGRLSARVRDLLWNKVIEACGTQSGAILIHQDPHTEWGLSITVHGQPKRRIVDCDGLQLVQFDHPNTDNARKKLRSSIPPYRRRQLAENLAKTRLDGLPDQGTLAPADNPDYRTDTSDP